MEWQNPQWLYLILPLAVAWLVLALESRRRRRRAALAFVAQPMWSRILPPDSPARFWIKLLLREAAIIAGLVALAGPRFGTQYEDVVPRGADLYVLIDVSRSMLAEDVPPSRLARAKADVAALVNRLEGERVGLIAFAGQAVVKCPMTVDYDAFRRSLDELDPNSAPRGGTAIGDAIRKALEVFQARSDRDQAILLITDGDDQQSYPLEAAAVAAERHVTIFTVGLGDADHGARIPKAGQSKAYLEYQGQQVWSKLDGSLLKEIALKTSGVYVPVGTRAYDLGELYTKYLQGRRGGDEKAGKRIRQSEQFQIFLALALLALIIDALIAPYPRVVAANEHAARPNDRPRRRSEARLQEPAEMAAAATATGLLLALSLAASGRAEDPADVVRDGMSSYNKGDFAKAGDQFAKARAELDKADAAKAAIAAFDQACAAHKKGDAAQAKEWYLKAGLAHDKALAASAHFNLGTLSAEEARKLAGEQPENVSPEKRPEILEQLKGAVASFRHCLELDPTNAHARRDIELVRQWVKFYSDRWAARDREKRRQETNLLTFLEFLIETQRALRESVKSLPPTAPADAYAEPKRLQEELAEEIGPLKDKIKAELMPPPQPGAQQPPPSNSSELEQGIALLEGWATTAGEKMASAAHLLDERQAEGSAGEQLAAINELEKIWEAVIPFAPLLARDLAEQTKIAQALAPTPASPSDASAKPAAPAEKNGSTPATAKEAPSPAPASASAPTQPAAIANERDDLGPLAEIEERTQRRTQLLKLKAEAELERLEKAPPPAAAAAPPDDKNKPAGAGAAPPGEPAPPKPVDPKLAKAGYQKAIELSPKAAEQMDKALKALKKKNADTAYPPAEEARKILEEIQKAQPKQEQPEQKKNDQDKKNDEQQKQDQKDEQKNDQQKKDEQTKKDQGKDEQEKKEEQKKEQEKGDQQKKDEQKKQDDKGGQAPKDQQQPQVSRDQIEDALRKVRERQQEKRERDRRMKARIIGRAPVEKDW